MEFRFYVCWRKGKLGRASRNQLVMLEKYPRRDLVNAGADSERIPGRHLSNDFWIGRKDCEEIMSHKDSCRQSSKWKGHEA